MTQSADLQKGLVRILTDGDEARHVVGAGFLVLSRHILTCAHVVADALGIPEDAPAAPTESVWLDWPLVAGSAPMTAKIVGWHPVNAEIKRGELEDIAVLELTDERPLPDAAQPVPVVVVEDQAFFDRPVRMYGFAEDRGDWVSGQLQGTVATGWVQLDHDLGRLCVASGFSGTAVWDKRENAAVGMIVSIATRETVRSAYMIPVASLIRAWPALDEHSRPPNPYRGLEAFREQDARYFMGRDRDIQDVLAMLQQRPFVAVVGASGSGKSSLLFAGVVPQLRKQGCWLIADFRPRGDPFRELATALTLLLYPGLDELERLEKRKQLADKLNERSLNLVDVVDLLLRSYPGKRLLLIADQFEELYTQNLAPERQRQFLDELAAAVRAQAKKPAFTLLLAMRVDFLGQALDYEPFAELIKPNHLLLGPMGQAGLAAAIESPARQLGVKLEEGLAERILQDLGQEPGTLPLLEFALTQLWERQQYRQLTHAAYEAIGGVTQALARHADETLARFQDERDRLRRVFVQLVRPGEGTEDTRQVATREQVGADNWNLVTELADERLVVTGRDAQGQETVEVVHEALLRHWQPLRQWIEQDRQFRVWQNRLRLALQEWHEQGHDEGALLRGARLAEAAERLNNHMDELNRAEKEYIKSSIAVREREAAEHRRRQRQVISGLTVGLLVALLLIGMSGFFWHRSEQQRHIALARQLAAQAGLVLDGAGSGQIRSGLLATESLQHFSTPEGFMAWAGAMELLPHRLALNRIPHKDVVGSAYTITTAVFSPDRQRLATASEYLMVWLWDVASGRELARLNHENVVSMAFSPDGQRLATAGKDKTARIWDVSSGRELARLNHENKVVSVAFSPNGQHLATGSWRSEQLWDVASGRELAHLTRNRISGGWTEDLAFSPDGTRLASADTYVRLWNIASGQELARLPRENLEGMMSTVAFSPDGTRLAGGGGSDARLWDVASSRELVRLRPEYQLVALAFSPDGQRLATASTGKAVQLWDPANGRELVRLNHEGPVSLMVFSPDGQRLATATGLNNQTVRTVRVWDLTTGQELARLAYEDQVLTVTFSLDGQHLTTMSKDQTLQVWDLATRKEFVRLPHEGEVTAVAFSPDGQRLATASDDKTARLWDAANGRELARLAHEARVSSVAFSPDGQHLSTASWDKTARLWETAGGRELTRLNQIGLFTAFSLDGRRLAAASDGTTTVWDLATEKELAHLTHAGKVEAVAFSPDGQRLATASIKNASEDKTGTVWDLTTGMVHIWDLVTAQELARLTRTYSVGRIIFSPDGRRLATASKDNTVRLWDAASGRELARLEYKSSVTALAFSPDGQRLATASGEDYTARLWNAASGRELASLAHGSRWVKAVVFSPDGQRLATTSDDKTARVWDLATGQELARLNHADTVQVVAFSPDGQRLATASGNTVRVWLWRAEDLIAEACKRLPRNLTHQEWWQYVGEEVPYHATCPNLPVPED